MNPSEIRELIEVLNQRTAITEYDFKSDVPVIGPILQKTRQLWNNIASRWYMRHYAQQQLQFQQTLLQVLLALYETMQNESAESRQTSALVRQESAAVREESNVRTTQLAQDLHKLAVDFDKLAASLRDGDVRDHMLKLDIDAVVRQLTQSAQPIRAIQTNPPNQTSLPD